MFFEKRRFSIEFNFQIKDFFLDEIPTNPCSSWGFVLPIIPYQVITGNYNWHVYNRPNYKIIPYQVITGNYNYARLVKLQYIIIPYQVITGNYNSGMLVSMLFKNYTIPSDNRELQLLGLSH